MEHAPHDAASRRRRRRDRARAARFEEIYRTHHDRVRRYVARRVRGDVVDDVVATTFATAWRRIDDVPVEEPARTAWLIRTAHLASLNERRSARRSDALAARVGQHLPDEASRSDDDLVDQLDPHLVEALEQLSPVDRYVVVATAWADRSAANIAEVLGCSPGAARTRLSRAKDRLRQLLRRPRPDG